MKSHINLSEQQHKQRLRRRHLRGAIYENLYRLALVLAVAALITLLIQISTEAFGPVLSVPVNALEDITDTPRDELSPEDVALIITEEMGNNLVTLVREEYGAITNASFTSLTIAETLRGNTFPEDIADQTGELKFSDLTEDQIAAFMVLNTSEQRLQQMLQNEIIRNDFILEWAWPVWLFDRDRVYLESAEELTGDLARQALGIVEDNEETSLADALATYLGGTENAEEVAGTFEAAQDTLLSTDWRVENRHRDASMTISEQRGGTQIAAEVSNLVERNLQQDIVNMLLETSEITQFSAEDIADRLASGIVRDGGLEELGSFDQRNILAALMIPDFADVLRAGEYSRADVRFISWLDWRFLTETGSNSVPEDVTLRVAILGSVWVMMITIVTSFPLGVGAAIYLEEYATDNAINNLIETNIRNLAGVPSIIYGLLGLAVFARALETLTDGRTVLSAGLTLALLILPVIIINSQEAIRAVPRTIREASYGLGATKWQTIWRQILPAAFPGILTGTILAFSRAVGETAPLIVVGAAAAISSDPSIFSQFTVIPIQIFNWTEEARPEYQHLAAAAIIVLLVLLIFLNSTAIALRNRFSNKLD